jgi:hypothetical protein
VLAAQRSRLPHHVCTSDITWITAHITHVTWCHDITTMLQHTHVDAAPRVTRCIVSHHVTSPTTQPHHPHIIPSPPPHTHTPTHPHTSRVQLDASEAAHQAQVQAYTRVVGRGGLDEEADGDVAGSSAAAAAAAGSVIMGPSAGAGARRANAAVSEAQVVRHPSEAERVLQLLQQQIGKLGMTRWVGLRWKKCHHSTSISRLLHQVAVVEQAHRETHVIAIIRSLTRFCSGCMPPLHLLQAPSQLPAWRA